MHKSALFIAALLAFASANPSHAQRRAACPGNEFKTRSGECVNPSLSSKQRCLSIFANQVMINQDIRLPLACDVSQYPRGVDVNRFERSIHGTGSTSP
jgi:hypothetical protein